MGERKVKIKSWIQQSTEGAKWMASKGTETVFWENFLHFIPLYLNFESWSHIFTSKN